MTVQLIVQHLEVSGKMVDGKGNKRKIGIYLKFAILKRPYEKKKEKKTTLNEHKLSSIALLPGYLNLATLKA